MGSNLPFFNTFLMYLYLNLVVYVIPLILLYVYVSETNVSVSSIFTDNNFYNFFTKITLLLVFLNLAGLPPLPGFFLKLNLFFFLSLKTNLLLTSLIVVFNFIVFFFYIKNYKNYSFKRNKITKGKDFQQNKNILLLFSYIIFFPVFCWYIYTFIWCIFI